MAKFAEKNVLDYRLGGDTLSDFAQKYIAEIPRIYQFLNNLRTHDSNGTEQVEPEPYQIKVEDDKFYVRNKANDAWVYLFDAAKNGGMRSDSFGKQSAGSISSRPDTGNSAGDLFWDTDSGKVYMWLSDKWQLLLSLNITDLTGYDNVLTKSNLTIPTAGEVTSEPNKIPQTNENGVLPVNILGNAAKMAGINVEVNNLTDGQVFTYRAASNSWRNEDKGVVGAGKSLILTDNGTQLADYSGDAHINLDVGATIDTHISTHNTASDAHQDIRTAVSAASIAVASSPSFYQRASLPTPSRTKIAVPSMCLNIDDGGYVLPASLELDLADTSAWDSTTYATAANRAGKDFYIYACKPSSGTTPLFILSANSTVPTGYEATTSRKIGGFHCLCADVGTISGHALSGYVAGDILPASVWDLKFRATSENEGMVWDGSQWVDIYLDSWDGSSLVSSYGGVVADGESTKKFHGELFVEEFAKVKKHLISRDQYVAFAKGSNEKTNIKGSADANTTGGHVDTAGRRMISNIGCEDCCGWMWQWTSDIGGHPNFYTNDSSGGHMSDMQGGASQTTSAEGDHWLIGYVWQDDGRSVTNINVDGSTNIYGHSYGVLSRALVGGGWVDGSSCGSRSVSLANLSSCRYGGHAGRGASEPRAAIL